MELGDLLSPDEFIPEMGAANRWEAIDELINQLVITGKIKAENCAALITAVKQREIMLSTGIGFGFGVPHATTKLVDEVIVIFGCSKKGIEFDAPDRKPVHNVALFLAPAGKGQKHMAALVRMGKVLARLK